MASIEIARRSDLGTAAVAMAGGLVPGVAFLAWFVSASWAGAAVNPWFLVSDDAMVSMTYARTLVETGEWVWFPGAERVQGFTNPLWTLYMALLQLMGLSGSAAALALILTGVVLVLWCAIVAGQVVNGLMPGARWQQLATGLTVASVPLLYPLTFWTLRGMEVGLLALLLLVMVLAAVRTLRAWDGSLERRPTLAVIGVAAALGVATRLDFLVLAGVVLGLLLLWAPVRWRVVLAALPPVVTAGAVLGFQRAYYGDWLPNTYALKMEGVPVWDRVLHGVWTLGKSFPWLLLAAVGLVAILIHVRERNVRRAGVLIAGAIAISAGYHVWVGGDAWETSGFANRFLAVALPLVMVLVVRGAAAWLAVGAPGGRGLVLGVMGGVAIAAGGLGLAPFPDHFVPASAAVGMVAAALVIPLAFMAVSDFRRRPQAPLAPAMCLAAAVLATLLVTSALPTAAHLRVGAEDANRGDSRAVRAGLALSTVTDDGAKVAVWAAGAIAYYSRRPMIDVLGKSDRRIANLPARLTLGGTYIGIATGHDKWDLDISVRELAPDVVVGPWNVPSVLDELASFGYEPRCTTDGIALYLRTGSRLIHWEALRPCTPTELETP